MIALSKFIIPSVAQHNTFAAEHSLFVRNKLQIFEVLNALRAS